MFKERRSYFISLLIIFIVASMHINCIAQQRNVQTGNQQWLHYFNRYKLNDKFSLNSDAGIRFRDGFDNLSQYVVRTAVSYKLNSNLNIAAGFANSGFYNDGKLTAMEYRPHQEITHKTKIKKNILAQRIRIEERFFDYPDKVSDFNFRFRYRVLVNIPVYQWSSNPLRKINISLADEVFLNAGKNIVYNTFDHNRLIGGIEYATQDVVVALNYNRQFIRKNLPDTYSLQHVLWFTVTHSIDNAAH